VAAEKAMNTLPASRPGARRHRSVMIPVLGEIIGWEALLVIGLIAVLFGSSQLPKLARSVGQASRELRHGLHDEPASSEPPPPVA
jgi:sec-independent protein translocase protein TatA